MRLAHRNHGRTGFIRTNPLLAEEAAKIIDAGEIAIFAAAKT
jgi:hypothetical protein